MEMNPVLIPHAKTQTSQVIKNTPLYTRLPNYTLLPYIGFRNHSFRICNGLPIGLLIALGSCIKDIQKIGEGSGKSGWFHIHFCMKAQEAKISMRGVMG